jgi:Cutinase
VLIALDVDQPPRSRCSALKSELDDFGSFGAASDIKTLGVQYRALGTESDPLRMLYGADYMSSIYDGVNRLVAMISDESTHCPNEKIVLAGYSQGALAIHIALRQINSSSRRTLDHIAGVALIADPAKTSYGAEYTLEEDTKEAGTGVAKAEGIWTKFSPADVGQIPSAVAPRTIAMCRNHDPVCAPPGKEWIVARLAISVGLHTDDYYETRTTVLGRWIADSILGRNFILQP